MYKERQERVCKELETAGLTQMIVSDPMAIRYLTGINIEPYERLFALYLSTTGHHKLFLNNLFTVPETGLEEVWMTDTDDVMSIVSGHVDKTKDIGIDKTWPARFLLGLMEHNKGVRYVNASFCVDHVRSCKDADEREKMRVASKINDECTEHMSGFIKEGMTEKHCAEEVLAFYKSKGCEGPSFTPICSFGANAADPHHEPDETKLKAGDCIVLDIGCKKDGYCSDMTRTWFCKKVSEDGKRIHKLVREAGEKAEKMIKPGIKFCELDKAARDFIAEGGYTKEFNHRLGHSIGLQDHECNEDVSLANTDTVRENMVFSIEPGVYVAGKIGVRVEDLVIVTGDGCEILNHVDRNYRIIG